MRSGTATMRVRVRPIGKFTLELRRRGESASHYPRSPTILSMFGT
jgi:hypothetical protein